MRQTCSTKILFVNAAYLKQSNAILKRCRHRFILVQICWWYGVRLVAQRVTCCTKDMRVIFYHSASLYFSPTFLPQESYLLVAWYFLLIDKSATLPTNF